MGSADAKMAVFVFRTSAHGNMMGEFSRSFFFFFSRFLSTCYAKLTQQAEKMQTKYARGMMRGPDVSEGFVGTFFFGFRISVSTFSSVGKAQVKFCCVSAFYNFFNIFFSYYWLIQVEVCIDNVLHTSLLCAPFDWAADWTYITTVQNKRIHTGTQ